MRHEPHVRLVDAHAEGNRRRHDEAVLLQKAVLILPAQAVVHAGVIGERGDALPAKKLRQFLRLLARTAIDDAAFAPVRADEIHKLAAGIALRAHGKVQVRAVEAVNEDRGRPREKPALDIAACGRIGRRGQRHDLNARRVFGCAIVLRAT